ncbi:hypothetical protein G6K98_32285 [Agrobacterium rhizogenes]|nr:hypothetical protein [Rhizobium rhizogenes]NTH62194.1 hypothetical protein [Rhizobium rhizogenes]NTH93820.1 hypothetical protein [Rhizobium rhizogenes]
MNIRERAKPISAVANALQLVAEEAEEPGEALAAANSRFFACSLRDYSSELGKGNLRIAELPLEQGIIFVSLLNIRAKELLTVH